MQKPEITIILLSKLKNNQRLWGLKQLALKQFFIKKIPGLVFFKVLGSGKDAGFGLQPSFVHQGALFHFRAESFASQFLKTSEIISTYKEKSDEFFLSKLEPISSRGSWSGNTIDIEKFQPSLGPVASLTRASIRLSKAKRFWSFAPAAEISLANKKGCMLAVGLGEAPVLRQATFSIWESLECLDTYARTGSHLNAIRAAAKEKYFKESMFVRFKAMHLEGSWKGIRFD